MTNRKLYAIGDIHGCFDALVQLYGNVLADAGGDPAKIVFLGDYCDRGPQSFDVVNFLDELKKNPAKNPNVEFVFLMGNHDQMFLDAISGSGSESLFLHNGGLETMRSYETAGHGMEYHREFFETLVPIHKDGKYVFVHAGIDPHSAWDDQDLGTMLWERKFNHYNGNYVGDVFVVHGHTPVEDVYHLKNQINIDTGCVFGRTFSDYGKLTAIRIDGDGQIARFQTRQYPLESMTFSLPGRDV
jgi:serine/threonine protein phosphatase 1